MTIIVHGADGVNNRAIVAAQNILENGKIVREYVFRLACYTSDVKATDLEVALDEPVTCVLCVQWKTT